MGVDYRVQWIKELFVEISTVVFFVFTAYKFRPAPNNPYLTLQQEENEDEEQMYEVDDWYVTSYVCWCVLGPENYGYTYEYMHMTPRISCNMFMFFVNLENFVESALIHNTYSVSVQYLGTQITSTCFAVLYTFLGIHADLLEWWTRCIKRLHSG